MTDAFVNYSRSTQQHSARKSFEDTKITRMLYEKLGDLLKSVLLEMGSVDRQLQHHL